MVLEVLLSLISATIIGGAAPPSLVRYLSTNLDSLTDVVLVAHEDDWQLFMGDVLIDRRRLTTRTIFIYLTAGDDGRDSTYWRTRERAALASTQLESSGTNAAGDNCKFAEIGGHSIWRCGAGNVESYFVRLPDGKRNGRGFASHQFESMWKMNRVRTTRISAIDGSSIYAGWRDLANTIAAIAADSSRSRIYIHANDPSVVVNPHDHTDHRVAGLLAKQLSRDRNWDASYYVGYALATRAENLSSRRRQLKTSLFLQYDREMTRVHKNWSAYREHPKFYDECMGRTYYRVPRARR